MLIEFIYFLTDNSFVDGYPDVNWMFHLIDRSQYEGKVIRHLNDGSGHPIVIKIKTKTKEVEINWSTIKTIERVN